MILKPEFKLIVEGAVCHTHKQHPVFVIEEGNIMLTCCCEEFKLQCLHLLKKMSANQISETRDEYSNG